MYYIFAVSTVFKTRGYYWGEAGGVAVSWSLS